MGDPFDFICRNTWAFCRSISTIAACEHESLSTDLEKYNEQNFMLSGFKFDND